MSDLDRRIKRALTQRLFVADVEKKLRHTEVTVFGSTGNAYSVRFANKRQPSCDCPDFRNRDRRNTPLCKHILFVLLRGLKLKRSDIHDLLDISFESNYWDSSKLRVCQEEAPQIAVEALKYQKRRKRKREDGETESNKSTKRRSIEGDCSVCLEPMDATKPVASFGWCDAYCGNPFHEDCKLEIVKFHAENNQPGKCPLCRGIWFSPSQEEKERKRRKKKLSTATDESKDYLNFEDLIEQEYEASQLYLNQEEEQEESEDEDDNDDDDPEGEEC